MSRCGLHIVATPLRAWFPLTNSKASAKRVPRVRPPTRTTVHKVPYAPFDGGERRDGIEEKRGQLSPSSPIRRGL